jgi:hypothetical protein
MALLERHERITELIDRFATTGLPAGNGESPAPK